MLINYDVIDLGMMVPAGEDPDQQLREGEQGGRDFRHKAVCHAIAGTRWCTSRRGGWSETDSVAALLRWATTSRRTHRVKNRAALWRQHCGNVLDPVARGRRGETRFAQRAN